MTINRASDKKVIIDLEIRSQTVPIFHRDCQKSDGLEVNH